MHTFESGSGLPAEQRTGHLQKVAMQKQSVNLVIPQLQTQDARDGME